LKYSELERLWQNGEVDKFADGFGTLAWWAYFSCDIGSGCATGTFATWLMLNHIWDGCLEAFSDIEFLADE
jgi:hypothetical protein